MAVSWDALAAWDMEQPDSGWGATIEAPAVVTPQYGSGFEVLDRVASSMQTVATSAAQLRSQVNAARIADSRARLELQQSQAGIELQRMQTGAAVDVERLRAQATVAAAQKALRESNGTTILQASPPARDWLMLALAAASVWFAYKGAK